MESPHTGGMSAEKTVVITGGNGGLGLECARAIAARDDGWTIVLASRDVTRTAAAAEALAAATTAESRIQYPGRQDRIGDPMVDDLTAIAAAVVQELPPVQGGNVALFGHSMGATVAFEAARLLEGRGTTLAVLFVSGRPAASVDETKTLHLQSDQALLDDMRRLGGPDSQAVEILEQNPDLAELVLPYVRTDYRAVETYPIPPGRTFLPR